MFRIEPPPICEPGVVQVPPCWYQPVENKGLHWHPDTGEVNEVAPDKKQQGAQ